MGSKDSKYLDFLEPCKCKPKFKGVNYCSMISENKRFLYFLQVLPDFPRERARLFAQAGFIPVAEGRCVQCPYCYIYTENWKTWEDPLHEHRIRNYNCGMLTGRSLNVTPVYNSVRELPVTSMTLCGYAGIEDYVYIPWTLRFNKSENVLRRICNDWNYSIAVVHKCLHLLVKLTRGCNREYYREGKLTLSLP